MNPAEACRYMADPANWRNGKLIYPDERRPTGWGVLRLCADALDDTAEIVNTAPTESRHEARPCVQCHEIILPGEAYTLRPNGYPIHARHAPRR